MIEKSLNRFVYHEQIPKENQEHFRVLSVFGCLNRPTALSGQTDKVIFVTYA